MVSQIKPLSPADGSSVALSGAERQTEEGIQRREEQAAETPVKTMQFNMGGTVLTFDVDLNSKEVVIKVADERTGEVIREIPPEVMRRVSEVLSNIDGHLLDKRI